MPLNVNPKLNIQCMKEHLPPILQSNRGHYTISRNRVTIYLYRYAIFPILRNCVLV